jgi:hypothetical protein
MSESSSKRGPKRRFTDSERKHRKREWMLNWVIWAGYGLETSVIVGMSSDQFYEWKPTMKWRKYFWTGKCNAYILTMKINRTLWLIEVINLLKTLKEINIYLSSIS